MFRSILTLLFVLICSKNFTILKTFSYDSGCLVLNRGAVAPKVVIGVSLLRYANYCTLFTSPEKRLSVEMLF